ncbi:hypothetical protein [Pontibacter rugosus]
MKSTLYTLYVFLFSLLMSHFATAQNERSSFTGTNRVMVALEGPLIRYDFVSKQMFVRHNKEAQRLECVIPVVSLLPLQDSVPPAMLYNVLFGAKYPQLLIRLHVPTQSAVPNDLLSATSNLTASVQIQGVTNETRVPVTFNTIDNTLYFTTALI